MSNLEKLYKSLKSSDAETFYLFKAGLFYIFLDEDAKKISEVLHLKLTNLTPETVKCGFPQNSLIKYTKLLEELPYNYRVIDSTSNLSYSLKDYTIDKGLHDMLKKIQEIDINNLTVREAYETIEKLQNKCKELGV